MKLARKRAPASPESEAEVRELRELEARVLGGAEPLVSGARVVRQTMVELARDARRRLRSPGPRRRGRA
jgi:hypothetical protein